MSAILTTLLGGLLAISGGLVGIALNDRRERTRWFRDAQLQASTNLLSALQLLVRRMINVAYLDPSEWMSQDSPISNSHRSGHGIRALTEPAKAIRQPKQTRQDLTTWQFVSRSPLTCAWSTVASSARMSGTTGWRRAGVAGVSPWHGGSFARALPEPVNRHDPGRAVRFNAASARLQPCFLQSGAGPSRSHNTKEPACDIDSSPQRWQREPHWPCSPAPPWRRRRPGQWCPASTRPPRPLTPSPHVPPPTPGPSASSRGPARTRARKSSPSAGTARNGSRPRRRTSSARTSACSASPRAARTTPGPSATRTASTPQATTPSPRTGTARRGPSPRRRPRPAAAGWHPI